MASQLVDDVRRLLRDRAEAGVPLTALERTFLLAAMAPRSAASGDVVDELEEAITYARRVLLGDPPKGTDPAVVDQRRREAARRLLAAARAAISYDPFIDTEPEVNATAADTDSPRPHRLDVDGYADR